ncbi:hypothetical protein jhhlp_000357 [Lomentospora prolificans]|uniref:Uncharacterized protein n=1 Tax=Lomentospora prolificans TaxID=41688 RepID=A0A2N3NKL5_9PEZI|nr:hypothetical protein jhhlp_000357 [Lomentospora prolificans]
MRFSVIVAAAVAAFAPQASAAVCRRWKTGAFQAYTVQASGVDNIPGVCGGLWNNLKQFGACAVPSMTDCSGSGGNLEWTFQASAGCNGGMVEATWWDATENRFGGINCP